MLSIVVDVEHLFLCVHKEEDADTKQVYFYLFKVVFKIDRLKEREKKLKRYHLNLVYQSLYLSRKDRGICIQLVSSLSKLISHIERSFHREGVKYVDLCGCFLYASNKFRWNMFSIEIAMISAQNNWSICSAQTFLVFILCMFQFDFQLCVHQNQTFVGCW